MTDQDRDRPLKPLNGFFTPIKKARRRAPSWVVKNLLPPGFVFLIGPPKDALKTTMVTAIACEVAGYKQEVLPVSWEVSMGGPVMMFSYEDDAGEIKFAAEDGMGIVLPDDDGILIADDPGTYRLDDEDAVAQMLEWLNDRKPRLVTLDPLVNFHSVEERDAGQMIKILAPLRKWAKDNDACFLVVHHPRKLEEDREYKAKDLRGSTAMFGLCDGILVITPKGEKGEMKIKIEATFKKHKPWEEEFVLAAWHKKGTRGHAILSGLRSMVFKAVEITKGGATLNTIAVDLNVKEDSIKKEISKLVAAGLVRQEGRRYVVRNGA